jgi:hypothetical protein
MINHLKEIGSHAFYFTGLTSVILPQNITKYECLVQLFIKEILKEQGIECSKCFADTEDINREIIKIDKYGHCTIPEEVMKIGNKCFSYGRQLISVKIPESVKEIGDRAFFGCPNLTLVIWPSTRE